MRILTLVSLLILAFPTADVGWLAIPASTLLLLSMRLRHGEHAGRQQFVAALILYVWGLRFLQPVTTLGWLFTAAWFFH